MYVIDAMMALFPKLCPSKSAARRLIKQGAVKVDDLQVEDELAVVTLCHVNGTNYHVVALVEGDYARRLASGENVSGILPEDHGIIESHTTAMLSVGKKNRGLLKLGDVV